MEYTPESTVSLRPSKLSQAPRPQALILVFWKLNINLLETGPGGEGKFLA